MFEITSTKGGQPLYRPTEIALSSTHDRKKQREVPEYMDDESFSYSLEIDVDDNNVITDILPLKIERCQWIGITRECWLPYPVSIDDYEEGGLVDGLIESNVTFAEEE